MKKNREFVFIISILLLAVFLRVYRVSELTEFLGDQGREGIVIYQWFRNGIVPQLGPPVSTGQYLGPIFYYLIAPFYILFNFNPVVPAIFMAIISSFSIFLLFYTSKKIFNKRIGYAIALLYATSPLMISQERTLWNPTLIPFFVLIFILSSYKILQEKKFKWLLLSSFSTAVLIQLHYSNLIFIPFCTAVWIYSFFKTKKPERKNFILWSLLAAILFILILLPFLDFEVTHQFSNTYSIIENYIFSNSVQISKHSLLLSFFDVFIRSLNSVFATSSKPLLAIFGITIVIFPFLNKNLWHKIFVIYFLISLAFVSFSVNNPPDHYLRFIYPIVFLLIASFIFYLKKHISKKILLIIATLLIVSNLLQIGIFKPGNNDIGRTKKITETIVNLTDNKPFSFTLISSRSFSDLHYRYFFTINNIKLEQIEDNEYKILFLVCESGTCPTKEEMQNRQNFQVLCYDPLCDKKYPQMALGNWQLTKIEDIDSSRIFVYEKQ